MFIYLPTRIYTYMLYIHTAMYILCMYRIYTVYIVYIYRIYMVYILYISVPFQKCLNLPHMCHLILAARHIMCVRVDTHILYIREYR